jgi:peptide/nickel transport system substrate-binding protein
MTKLTRRTLGKLLAGSALISILPRSLQAAETPIDGGTIRTVMAIEPVTQVEIMQSAGGAGVGARVLEGLVTEGVDLKLAPQLATSWEVSDDGLNYTFHLRDGVEWHDGKPFTSADVSYSYWMLKEIHPRRRATFANLEKIDDTDPLKVVLHFSKPAPALLPALNANSAPIVPKHLYEGTDPRTNPYNAKPVGTGPFVFREWERGSHTLLEKNANYWQPGLPHADAVIIRYVLDPVTRLAAFEAGEVDVSYSTPVPLSELGRFTDSVDFKVDTDGYALGGNLSQIFFNLRFEPFQNLKVRQAVAHAVNVDDLIAKVWHGYAVAAPSAIVPAMKQFYDPSIKPFAFDPSQAEKLLDEAGYPRGADGTRFSVRFTANPFMSQIIDSANFARSALANVGIRADIALYDHPTYIKKLYTEGAFDLDIQCLANGYDPTDGIQRAYHSRNIKKGLAWSNHANYSNPDVDRIFDEAAYEANPEKRRALYVELQQILYRDLPAVNLVAFQPLTISRSAFRDHVIDQQSASTSYTRAWLTDGGA